MIPGKATLVPTRGDHPAAGGGDERLPTLRILYHPDLRRIGGVTPGGVVTPRQPLNVGRLEPEFIDPDSGACEPLDDPCISREQLTLTWSGPESFSVVPCGARSIELFSLDGRPAPAPLEAGPGTIIDIGNRVLLLLQMGSSRQGQDRLGLDGASEAMWALRDGILAAAASDSSVLVHGESGVGKERVARAIHNSSPRSNEPQLAVNCAAIPEHLLESELFGHVRGAFTGADADRAGFFRAAAGGTLLLDEIGELPLALQSKILRVLEERMVCPVGAVSEVPVHARVVAATNRDLRQEAAEGRFREDLYYRLSTLVLRVPPLRRRREDIPLLFRRFLADCTERHPELERLWAPPSEHAPPVPQSLVRSLLSFDWPGNVRHLRNMVERIALANLRPEVFTVPEAVSDELLDGQAAEVVEPPEPGPAPEAPAGPRTVDDRELMALLEEHDFVQRRVAKVLGVSHTTIDRRMRELGLRRPRDLGAAELAEAALQADNDLGQMARLLRVSRRGLQLRLTALGMLPSQGQEGD